MNRFIRFARQNIVGGVCAIIQLGLFTILVMVAPDGDSEHNLYNAVAFVASAQVNFTLTRLFTFGDRPKNALFNRWAKFNTSVAVAWIANQTAFWVLLTQLEVLPTFAAFLAIPAGSIVSFIMNDKFVFPVDQVVQTTGD